MVLSEMKCVYNVRSEDFTLENHSSPNSLQEDMYTIQITKVFVVIEVTGNLGKGGVSRGYLGYDRVII